MQQNISDYINTPEIEFQAWHDSAAADGFLTDSDDALVWLTPILGPTATLLLHRIARYLAGETGTEAVILNIEELAGAMGTVPAKLRLTFNRLAQFGMIRMTPTGIVEVRSIVGRLPHRWVNRMPASLATACPYIA